jgi:HlyD family type I secretion membrane fusion protein
MLVLAFFVGFGGWAALAQLNSAAIALGVVGVESQRKIVQHLEGGIVAELNVREGDDVRAGQVLLHLDRTQPNAQVEFIRSRYYAALALESRLIAERDGAAEIVFPPELLQMAPQRSDIDTIMASQREIKATRQDLLEGRVQILEQGVAEYMEELKGLQGQIEAYERQLQSLAEDQRGVAELAERGLLPRAQLRELERRVSEIEGDRSGALGRVSQLRQSITESRLKINELQASNLTEVVSLLREVQGEVFELREQLRAAEDVLSRTEVRAPIDGMVVGLNVHTTGGVVAPGAPLLEIVPSDDVLIVEARLDPADIDVVRIGQPAQVRFTALNQRDARPVDGLLVSLSADAFIDESRGVSYYVAKVHLDQASLKLGLGELDLLPGMEAEVLILTGARTPLDYLLEPLTRSINRAMREG